MERSNVKFTVFVVLAIFWHVSFSIAMESTCTKFKYEEQLLEKMVRMEIYVENIVNDLNKTISDSVEGLAADIGNIQTNITRVVEDFQLQNEEWKGNTQRETTSALKESKTGISDTEKLLKAEIHDLQATVNKSSTETKLMEENIENKISTASEDSKEVIKLLKAKIVHFKENIQRETTAALEITKTNIGETEKFLKAEIHDLQATVNKSSTKTKLMEENIENKITPALEDAKKEIKLLKAEIDQFKETTPVVAFSAYHVTNHEPALSRTVVFDTVLLNAGECYDATTGYFTATVAGVYQFNAQLCVNKGVDLEYAITVDGKHIAQGEYRTSSDSGDGKCTAFSAIGIVRQGQKAEVRGWGGHLFTTNNDDWNSFSGVLIKAL